MILSLSLFTNTKAELFIKKARIRKIIISKFKTQKRPVCFTIFKNSNNLFCFYNKKRF